LLLWGSHDGKKRRRRLVELSSNEGLKQKRPNPLGKGEPLWGDKKKKKTGPERTTVN